MKKRTRWTQEELDEAKALRAEGLPLRLIGERLGRTALAVNGALDRGSVASHAPRIFRRVISAKVEQKRRDALAPSYDLRGEKEKEERRAKALRLTDFLDG